MVIKKFEYIKIGFSVPFIVIFSLLVYILFLYKASHPASLIIPVVILFFMFSKIVNIGSKIVKMELDRRISKIPVAKMNIFSWNYNNNIGVSFIETEKNTFWYCGTSTDFEIHIHSLQEIRYEEFNDHIVFNNINNRSRYVVYKYTS